MPNPALSPLDIIQAASIEGHKGAYVIGCFDQRITFYSQQVRALSLVHALATQDYLKDGPRVAVIGGGAAGLSAAAALSLTSSGQVVLFEEAQELLKLQSSTERRKLDPHIYNWPRPNAVDPIADLPILDWEAGPSREVRDEVVRQFEEIAGRAGNRLTRLLRHRVTAVRPLDSGYELTVINLDTGVALTEQFQLIFLAFGFGLEPVESIPGINDKSYWDNASVPGAEFQGRPNPRYFVSGNGDGGLIDLVAAASNDFDQAAMIRTISGQPGLDEIKRELLTIEAEARAARDAGTPIDLYSEYAARIGPALEATGLIAELVRQLRPGVHITLQTRETALFSLDTSILNRFAVFATVRACEAAQGRGFTHRVFARVDRDRTYAPAPGEAPFRLDCDGELLVFDEVIIRRGPEWQIVRQPFAGVLGDYEVQHRVWLKRLGDATLVPALSSDAQDFFRGLAIDNHILGSRRRIAIAEAAMPNAIHLSLDGAQVRWAGDIAPEAIADAWNTGAALSVTLADGPDALGPLGGAILRVVAHAPQAQVYADRLAWADGWKRLTAKSLHGSGLSMPLIEGGNPGGAAQERDTTSAARLAAKVHRELDKWMLQRIDAHLGNFLLNEDDPEGAIGLEIAADLRGLMRVTWQGWREAFEDDRALLQRFLRLVASATDEDSDAVQVLVGPRKVNAIICGTALSLAIATVWGQTAPRRARPGNLLRQIAGGERTGHGCAADRIQGQRTIRRAEAHAWETNFVLLALEGTLDLARQAEVAFANVETSQPSLAETTGSGPLIMWITEPLITALGQGTGAVAELLAELERRHAAVLTEAIERQEATV